MVGAFAGGALVPADGTATGWTTLSLLIFGVIGAECLFRGVLHGVVAMRFPVFARGSRVISAPNVVASLLATATVVTLLTPPPWLPATWPPAALWGVWLAGCLALSLGCGIARERWGSVWAAAGLHAVSAAAVLWAARFLA
jgi:hypothetical protein